MPENSFDRKDILELLAKLKEETPEYPAELVKARKESFLQQILDISVSGKGPGGDDGVEGPKGGSEDSNKPRGPGKAGKSGNADSSSGSSGSGKPGGMSASVGKGGSGAALSSGTTFLGFSLKSVIIFGTVVLFLTSAYLFRDQIVEYLAENEVIRVEETAGPPIASPSEGRETNTPDVMITPVPVTADPGVETTDSTPDLGENNPDGVTGTGDQPGLTQESPIQESGRATKTPANGPSGDLGSAIRFLICILQMGGESCR